MGGTASGAIGLDLRVFDSPREAQSAAAVLLVEAARAGEHICLSGGGTPGPAYELAAELESDWTRARLWWGDERCVPPDDERSNYLLVRHTLLDRLQRQPEEVHRIRGELGGEAAAAEYDSKLEGVTIGLALQGLGADGHTASLFPSSAVLDERERRAVAVPREDVERDRREVDPRDLGIGMRPQPIPRIPQANRDARPRARGRRSRADASRA